MFYPYREVCLKNANNDTLWFVKEYIWWESMAERLGQWTQDLKVWGSVLLPW